MKRTLTRIGTFLLALLIMVNIPLVAFAIPDVEPGQDIPSNEELVNVFSTEHNAVAEYLENGADNQLVSSESDIVGATIATGSIVAPFNNVGAHQVWSINHTTGYRGDYVDVRVRMDQITEQGMCWTMIIFDYDPAVLGNPRLSPRIERSALTSELQEAYDNLSGTLFETVLGPFRGGNAVLHNMIFEGVFSWNRGEVIVSWQSNPNPDIPDNFTSGIFVDVRFDILATAPFGESPIMFSQRPSNIFLAGVGTVVIPIVWESFSNGSTTVIFDLPEVRILNQHGNLITTASLTAARNGVTPVLSMDIIPGTGVDAGRFAVDGATIGDVFTASASGFQSASRTLSTTDVMANYIEIVLTHYANVPVTVHVMEGTRFVENATLVLQGNNVSGSGGIFNVMLSGRNVGNILTAAAQGLGYEEHTITFEDLVHPATIVINLTRQNVGLTITNVPGSLTHVNQTGTAGAGASETALMFDGTSNAVMFGSPVALSAGAVEEHHYFLGWYRGATAPTAGTPVSALTGVVTAENHTFNMPAEGLQYFALWGARGVIGNRSPRITFNIYGSMKNNAPGVLPARVRNSLPGGASGYTNQIAVPMVFGESLCLLAMEPIIEWMGGQESGFAFWGWFTEEALDASGRSRNSYRRPTVGTNGFDISRVFTEALFNTYADADNNINLNAIWALWGDVNDDDQINGLDVSLVSQHVRRFPGISIVEPAAHVSRGPAITGLDVSLISQYVRRFPGIVLGQPSSRALVLGAQMRLPDVSAPEIWDRASAFSGTTATSVLAANAPQTRSGGGIQRNTIGAHQIWSVSHEIGYRGDYVDIRLRMDQITAQGMCWTMFVLDFDTSVLSNPRLSPRIDREELTPDLQEAYDSLTGTLFEAVLGPMRGGNAMTHNMIFEGVIGSEPGEVIVSWQSNPNPEIPDNFTSGIFVDIRFDILPGAPIGISPVTISPRPNDVFLAGVGSIPLPVVLESFTNGSVAVVVDIPQVRVVDEQGNLITTALLAAARGNVTPVSGMVITAGTGVNAGRFVVERATVGDVFTASALGFYDEIHTLTAAEAAGLLSGTITYIEITLTEIVGHRYSVRFWMNDGTGDYGRGALYATEMVDTNGRTVTPPNPRRPGYTFRGWYRTQETMPADRFNFGTLITGNLDLYARWTPGEEVVHRVLFWRNDNSNNLHYADFVIEGERVAPPTNPERVNFTFNGWHRTPAGSTLFNFVEPIMSELRLYANWHDGTDMRHLVQFWTNDGSGDNGRGTLFAYAEVSEGRTVIPPNPNPTREYVQTFMEPVITQPDEDEDDECDEYYEDDEYYIDDDTVVDEDTAVENDEKDEDVITDDDDIADEDAKDEDAKDEDAKDEDAKDEDDDITGDDYVIADDAKVDDDEIIDDDSFITDDADDDAVTEDEEDAYETESSNGETYVITQGSDDLPEALDQIITFEIREETIIYTFYGWYTCQTWDLSTRFDFGTLITEPLDLYARWERFELEEIEITHTVLLHRNDGSENLFYAAFVPDGKVLADYMPESNPTRIGHIFTGWFVDQDTTEAFTDFEMTVEEHFSLFAGWAPAGHTVDFHRNDGSGTIHIAMAVQRGETAFDPGPIFRIGMVFRGWYIDAAGTQAFDFNTPIMSDIDLFARWGSGGDSGWWGTPTRTVLQEPAVALAVFAPYHNAFMVGFPDRTVRPHENLTRAEVVTILFRLLDDDYRSRVWGQSNTFADVHADQWFNNAISTMANAGILNRTELFRPNDAVTRAEFATMVARFFDDIEPTETSFYDIEGHWAEEYINIIAQFGWTQGVGNGEFNPDAQMTRAEAAAIVNRMLERTVGSTSDLLEERTRWPDKTNMSAWYYLYMQAATHSTEYERLDDGTVRWTAILPNINWTVLENAYSTPDLITAARALQQQAAGEEITEY